jgi:hypothetical protein
LAKRKTIKDEAEIWDDLNDNPLGYIESEEHKRGDDFTVMWDRKARHAELIIRHGEVDYSKSLEFGQASVLAEALIDLLPRYETQAVRLAEALRYATGPRRRR